jgi:hypothetical protein
MKRYWVERRDDDILASDERTTSPLAVSKYDELAFVPMT